MKFKQKVFIFIVILVVDMILDNDQYQKQIGLVLGGSVDVEGKRGNI